MADSALTRLRNARVFLADEDNWVQHYTERDGQKSILGAVGFHFYRYEGDHAEVMRACGYLALAIGRQADPYDYVFVEGVNDTSTHAEMLAVLDRAIAIAEAQPVQQFRRSDGGVYGPRS
jgi:hypothetical protein